MNHLADPIIVVNHVSKQYDQHGQRPSLRHELGRILKYGLGSSLRQAVESSATFCALKDVSFAVHAGESVGIVGRNGAGKTTLLRVLSGITHPTTGTVQVHGRFATLIGLGAGFMVERTGRENIFLNAALQGIPSHVTTGLIDEIISFAELADHIDWPVKFYSNGMMARLGFSIAAHIFPEIIFLDEVLAVGDVAFQGKCIERMVELRDDGRTLLFVSHSSQTVQALCSRTIWLQDGQLVRDGDTSNVLQAYHQTL